MSTRAWIFCQWLVCIPLVFAGTSIAQEPQETKRPKDKQLGRRPQRQRIVRPVDLEAEKKRMIEVLRLSKRQQFDLDRILEAYRQQFEGFTQEYRDANQDLGKREDLAAAIRDAHIAGDTEQVKELREQIKELARIRREQTTTAAEKVEAAQVKLHDDIVAILRTKQKEKFEKMWNEGLRRPPPPKAKVRNPRALLTLVERLEDLTKKQKDEVMGLFGDFYANHRQLSRAEAKSTLPQRQDKLMEDVMAVLTPKQREKIQKQLKDRQNSRQRGGRNGGEDKDRSTSSNE